MSVFLDEIEDTYPDYLLEKRLETEGNVIACMFADMTILDDHLIPETYFITKDGRFYYNLILELFRKGILTVDEVSIRTALDDENLIEYQKRGGYKQISHMRDVINLENFSAYYEELIKKNLMNKLYLDGFNLDQPVKYNKHLVVPKDLFESMTSDQILDFYDTLLSSYQIGEQSSINEEEFLSFKETWFNNLNTGESIVDQGTPYNVIAEDIFGTEIKSFSFLNNRTLGFHHGKLACLAAFSGTGKTTIAANMILALVHSGEKVLIISNEDTTEDFLTRIASILCFQVFHYGGITRDKFKRNDFTEEDKEVLKEAMILFNEEYGPYIKFVGTSETNPKFFRRKIKEAHLRDGCTAFWIDTLKLAERDFGKERTDLALVMNSRELANTAAKYNMIGICSLQLAERHRGILSCSSAQIGTAKQVKEILQQLIIARPLYPSEELDPNKKKTYCRPFRSEELNGIIVEKEVSPPQDRAYIVLALDKNRDGTCTPNDQISYLYSFDGAHSSFSEICLCRTAQATLANVRS